jgi:hypothetical protein
MDGQMAQVRGEEKNIGFAPVHLPLQAGGQLGGKEGGIVDGSAGFDKQAHIAAPLAVIHPRAEEPDAGFRAEAFRGTLADLGNLLGVETHSGSHAA